MTVGVDPSTAVGGPNFSPAVPGRIRLGFDYGYWHTRHLYFHEHRTIDDEESSGFRETTDEYLATLEVGITDRLAAIAEVPLTYATKTRSLGGNTGQMSGAGFGDVRMLLRYWLVDTDDHGLTLYAGGGVRLPTGEPRTFFDRTDGKRITADSTVQIGTGNTDFLIELGGAAALVHELGFFVGSRYYICPWNTAVSENRRFVPGGTQPWKNADPDSLAWRIGAATPAGEILRKLVREAPAPLVDGLQLTVAFSGSHVFYDNLIGGSSGFRNPGTLLFAEPGLVWSWERLSVVCSVPITVYRYAALGVAGMPEYVFQLGATVTVN